MRILLYVLAALLVAPAAIAQTPAPATAQAAPPFAARVQELPGILSGTGNYESFFSPGFRAAVPKAKFDEVNAQLSAAGPVAGIDGVQQGTPWIGVVTVRYRDARVTMRLAVDEAEPHQVSGLLVTGMTGLEKSLGEVTGALQALRGVTAFAFARLGAGAPVLIAQHNADKPLAIGSAFKLVILAELVRATNAGERKWDDRVTLDGSPLPAGGYTMKTVGTQITLRELATQMISISDNSATDILLKTLGRARVEAILPVLGVADPARNRPYLSTLEMFKLKGIEHGALARRYLAKDEAGRRAMLDGEIAVAPPSLIDPMLFRDGKPVLIGDLEWFFSPADLIRVMDWLRRNSEGPGGADARAVLSKNPGIAIDKSRYGFVGFKGGSEPGVINLTLLLQSVKGDWYAASASWNDPAQEIETVRFVGLMAALVGFAGPQP